MELWIPITLAAAFLQNLRSLVQKQLKSTLNTSGASFVRFAFGVPFAALYWGALMTLGEHALPRFSAGFLPWMIIGATAQIIATFLLVHLFSLRNFAVGNAYSRTEPMQTAVFAFVFFGTQFTAGAVLAICIAVLGVMLISAAQTKITPHSLLTSIFSKTAGIGLAAGTLFGLAAIGFQTATRSVISEVFLVQAASTLVIAITFQTLLMGAMIAFKDPGEFKRVRAAWKPATLVGFAGATATFCWFSAFALQEAALVKVLAQVEMLFSFAASIFVFKEVINRTELLGCALIVSSIICLVLLG